MKFADFVVKVFIKICFRVKIYNMEKLPREGGCIICANHLSNWDPVILHLFFPRKIRFLAKKELYKHWLIRTILTNRKAIKVNRENIELKTIKESINVIKEGDILGIFPQGTRKAELKEEDVKNGLAFIAYNSNAQVIPMKIEASYKFLSTVKIYIGDGVKPLKNSGLSRKENYSIFSQEIVMKIKELGDESYSG